MFINFLQELLNANQIFYLEEKSDQGSGEELPYSHF